MPSRIFRLNLDRAHFGDGGLERSATTVGADTLFSALCIEALKLGAEPALRRLHTAVSEGQLLLSDALPYTTIDGEPIYLVPKPLARVAAPGESDTTAGDSAAKKLAKRVQFLPVEQIESFLTGQADLDRIVAAQDRIGVEAVAARAAIHNGQPDADPYRVGVFGFRSDAGLWVLAQGGDDEIELLTSLLASLARAGIGGERSSGYGQFTLTHEPVPEVLATRMPTDDGRPVMSLSVALPGDSELDTVLAGSTYRLIKRSGFIASATYADTPRRKTDIFKFASGSVFRRPFGGVVADVSNGGSHPVYSYAKPLFLSLPAGVM